MSQRPTTKTMKSGTSENASPKRRGRPRKSNSPDVTYPGKGNPDFLLTPEAEAEALASFDAIVLDETDNVPHGTMVSTVTREDLELDIMLERAAKTNPIQDLGVEQPLVHEKKKRDTLRNYIEGYKPAATLMDLEDQTHQAKMNEIDSIEGTEQIVRHFTKAQYEYIKKNVGYFIYKDIRVYIVGFFEQNKNADSLTMEQRLHSGGSKADTVPIIRPQKV